MLLRWWERRHCCVWMFICVRQLVCWLSYRLLFLTMFMRLLAGICWFTLGLPLMPRSFQQMRLTLFPRAEWWQPVHLYDCSECYPDPNRSIHWFELHHKKKINKIPQILAPSDVQSLCLTAAQYQMIYGPPPVHGPGVGDLWFRVSSSHSHFE